ncbi:MAG: tetratricopeptide repeat protein [Anaerolineales bacterium]|nr:tetratricopeptide repeat protein [Anaerolineales bacterium]
MTAVINDFYTKPDPLFLILDDYHVIQNAAVHSLITFLLDHMPFNLHLVITTREDPLLPVARLRARGQVLEIRQQDLRFTMDETGLFLKQVMGLAITADEISDLERRTEGWIAGLQLAALSLRTCKDVPSFVQALTGSSRFILDFLMEEVVERQPPNIREFLLKTSILDRLTASLCDTVLETSGSQELLQLLDQANLFVVPLDQNREWFRYHRLFSELLRFRLRAAYPELESGLHRRAGTWFEEQGYVEEAVHHVLEGEDWQSAGRLIQQATTDYLKLGEVHTVINWFEQLPWSLLQADPKLLFDYCWPLLLASRYDRVEPLLTQLEQMAGEFPAFLGEIYAAQAFLARGLNDPVRMVERSQRALQLLPESAAHSRGIVGFNLGLAYWHQGCMQKSEQVLTEALQAARKTENHYAALTAEIFLGRVYAVRGELQRAAEAFKHALQQGESIPINALAYMDLAALQYEWNELDDCEKTLQQAVSLSKRGRNDEFLTGCLLLKSRLQIARGDFDSAEQTLQLAKALVRDTGIEGQMAARVEAARAYLLLSGGKPTENCNAKLFDQADGHPFYRFLGLTAARCMPVERSAETLMQLSELAQERDWAYGLINVHLIRAVCAKNQQEGLAALSAALVLAEAERFIRSFVDTGEALLPLLRTAAGQNICPDYVKRILVAMTGKDQAGRKALPDMVDPLSERELEVMSLVCAGLSNREIAEELVISTGTAKTHVHNICGKLGVRNRTEAAMKAREMGLVQNQIS